MSLLTTSRITIPPFDEERLLHSDVPKVSYTYHGVLRESKRDCGFFRWTITLEPFQEDRVEMGGHITLGESFALEDAQWSLEVSERFELPEISMTDPAFLEGVLRKVSGHVHSYPQEDIPYPYKTVVAQWFYRASLKLERQRCS
jgi:hypothetical protein